MGKWPDSYGLSLGMSMRSSVRLYVGIERTSGYISKDIDI